MKCGQVALIGRPNVGKSTLMNHLLKQKISITSRKPQTTRHRILGISTSEHGQIVYVDTPGMHNGGQRAINRYLNRTADVALAGVDAVVWLLDGLAWHDYDAVILHKLEQAGLPVILVVNKVDKIKDKAAILAFFAEAKNRFPFAAMLAVSALQGTNLSELEQELFALLPAADMLYPEDQVTDRPERFLCAEIVREKLTRRLGAELPYALAVAVERYEELPHITKIYVIIWVEKDSQKSIVIGAEGERLKKIGIDARYDIERLLGQKTLLKLWVKVNKGWSDNERVLASLGLHD